MGRIFEVRKHTCSRAGTAWRSSSRASPKDITMAVKSGGADRPPTRRCGGPSRTRARSTCPRTRSRRPSKRAGRDAANSRGALRGLRARVAPAVETATDNPTRTVAAVRNIITKGGGNPPPTAASASCSTRWACSAWIPPASIRMTSSSPHRPRPRGDGREHRRKGRDAAGDPRCVVRRLRPPAGGARGARHHARRPSTSTSARCRPELPGPRPPSADGHRQARAGR